MMKFKEYQKLAQRTCPDLHNIIENKHEDSTSGTLEFYRIDTLYYHEEPLKELLNLIHVRLGVISEIEELQEAIKDKDSVNISEELADMLWYTANDIEFAYKAGILTVDHYNTLINTNFESKLQATNGGTDIEGEVGNWMNALVFSQSLMSDYIKKHLAYGKDITPHFYYTGIKYTLAAINNIAVEFNINLEDAMQKNIDKLLARFDAKKGFTAEQALNRDLIKEREVLEATASAELVDGNITFTESEPTN